MIQFFGSPEEAQDAQARMEIEVAAANAAVSNLYASLNVEQLRALSVVYRAIIAHPGSPEHPVAIYHLGQITALLRYKFNMCSCGDDHKVEDHAKVMEDRESPQPEKPDDLEDPEDPEDPEDNSHILDEYNVEYIDGGPQVKCKGKFRFAPGRGLINCNGTWQNLDARMMRGRCETCGYGPYSGRE